MSRERLARAEATLAELPGPGPGLDAAAAARFAKARRRIHRHHEGWRDDMPSLDSLFDDDAHRARALAGNLGTELEDLLIAWARARAESGPVDEAAREHLVEATRRWRVAAADLGAAHGWEGEAAEVFAGFLRDLTERARQRAEAVLEGEASAATLPPARWRILLRRVARGPLLALRRFLRPEGT